MKIAHASSGMQINFITSTYKLGIRVKVDNLLAAPMPATLYSKIPPDSVKFRSLNQFQINSRILQITTYLFRLHNRITCQKTIYL